MSRPSHIPYPASSWLAAIVESSRDAIISKDLNGIIQTWNRGAQEIFGYTPEEAIGQPVTMLIPEDRIDEEPAILARIRQGERVEHYETIRRRKDGNLIDISLTISPIVDEEGRVIGASKIARNVTERKADLAELAKLAAIVESASDAIISKDLNGVIQSWNKGAEAIFGYTADEVIGKPVTILMPPERLDEEPGIIARIRRGEAVDHYQTVRRRKDGTLLNISLNVSPVRDSHGVVIGASKIARDVTEHIAVESALRDADIMHRLVETQEAERSRIALDLHDHIGQMLTGIRLKVERLLEFIEEDSELRSEVMSIREIAAKMDRDVGFLTRELRPTELDQLGLVNAIGGFVKEWSSQYGIAAEFESVGRLADGSALAKVVETNLYRIIQEALTNILKHADARHVSVLIHSKKDGIALIVEDDGRGFDTTAVDASEDNHGLGLVGMRERTELLGGTFEIESKKGGGTSIMVRIPLDRAAKLSQA